MTKEMEPMFKEIADQFWEEVPGLTSLWFRPEADDILDLRFGLKDDSWSAREETIKQILEMKRTVPDVFINFSFVLPDEAYSMEVAQNSEQHVYSFA